MARVMRLLRFLFHGQKAPTNDLLRDIGVTNDEL